MITNAGISGGTYAAVAPGLKGMYSEEVVAGIQYDVGYDLVLGASYIHRDLGRIIEDMSPNAGTYFIANPGEAPDASVVKDLQSQIASTSDPMKKAALTKELGLYQQVNVGFPKPKRNYDAMVLTATKRLSHNFLCSPRTPTRARSVTIPASSRRRTGSSIRTSRRSTTCASYHQPRRAAAERSPAHLEAAGLVLPAVRREHAGVRPRLQHAVGHADRSARRATRSTARPRPSSCRVARAAARRP